MHFIKLASFIFVNEILCSIGVGRECKIQYKHSDHMNLRPRERTFEREIQCQENHIYI